MLGTNCRHGRQSGASSDERAPLDPALRDGGEQLHAGVVPRPLSVHGRDPARGDGHPHGCRQHLRALDHLAVRLGAQHLRPAPRALLAPHLLHRRHRFSRPDRGDGDQETQSRALPSARHLLSPSSPPTAPSSASPSSRPIAATTSSKVSPSRSAPASASPSPSSSWPPSAKPPSSPKSPTSPKAPR